MAMAPAFSGSPDKQGGVLHPDVLYDILLLLPAKDLCRLRAVCRPWRALLSDPGFIAAHAARHPGPHIVAGYRHNFSSTICDILDLSGRVVKRVRAEHGTEELLICAHLDFLFTVVRPNMTFRLLDPATGAKFVLPDGFAEEHAARQLDIRKYSYSDAPGKVTSTGEYKVLRIIISNTQADASDQLYQVVTLGVIQNSRWRGVKPSPHPIELNELSAVVNGIVYFFTHPCEPGEQNRIAWFDLGKEEWGTTLISFVGEVDIISLSLATLNDCLVVLCRNDKFFLDIWFLVDSERGSWVKKYSIPINPIVQDDDLLLNPLLVLSDGRILLYGAYSGSLKIYNPSTSSSTNLAQINRLAGVGLYTGSLLSLANGASDN